MITPHNLPRTVLGVLFLGGLIAASFSILKPFLPATIWAIMVVVATWPLMRHVQSLLWNSRALAVAVMVLLLLVVFFVPLMVAIGSVVEHADTIASWPKAIASLTIPSPPEWLSRLPVVGARLDAAWRQFAASGPEEFAALLAPYQQVASGWILAELGGAGIRIVEFLLTVVIAAILYFSGEGAAASASRFAERLAGSAGERAVRLAGYAIRGVALGVVVTALVQSVLAGAGLAVAGVAFPLVLTGVMFILCLAQIGPLPVMVIAAGVLYWQGHTGWAIGIVIWAVLVDRLNQVLLPILIRRGADLPLLLVFAGVIGGLLAFGLIGIFIGPVVLAVSYRLLEAWVEEGAEPAEGSITSESGLP
jgi:predicted PurR-regulated permease PerM